MKGSLGTTHISDLSEPPHRISRKALVSDCSVHYSYRTQTCLTENGPARALSSRSKPVKVLQALPASYPAYLTLQYTSRPIKMVRIAMLQSAPRSLEFADPLAALGHQRQTAVTRRRLRR